VRGRLDGFHERSPFAAVCAIAVRPKDFVPNGGTRWTEGLGDGRRRVAWAVERDGEADLEHARLSSSFVDRLERLKESGALFVRGNDNVKLQGLSGQRWGRRDPCPTGAKQARCGGRQERKPKRRK